MEKNKGLFSIKAGDTLSFGVTKVADGVQFSIYIPGVTESYLKLYKKGRKEPSCVIRLTDEYKRGSVYFLKITGIKRRKDKDSRSLAAILSEEFEYMYETDGKEFIDPYAQVIHGRSNWGKVVDKKYVRGGICLEEFDWSGDRQIKRPFSELIIYQLHVRGYTRHSSSKVAHKGTFDGLMEKISYIRELGVNTVMLVPCYEFNEIQLVRDDGSVRFNYWGYGAQDTFYLAPKASYAADKGNPVREFKELIKQFHKAGIEVLMDIYFSPGTNLYLMSECLRHWILNYHIDGFRINNEVMPEVVLISDPMLSGIKLLTSYWEEHLIADIDVKKEGMMLAEYNEGFMNDARRFLKSDEGMVQTFVNRFKRNPDKYSVINFMTHINGFTMTDLVSYDIKHNESNGEANRDGTEFNYSWNCGVEGKTRKTTVLNRRAVQIRNAFTMLLCSQGTPMIFAGDEFGNTQYGNNNAYCHDDAITWLNWSFTKRDKEILEFVKNMIAFRKEHTVLRCENEFHMMDTKGVGIPDMSVHGTQAWKTDYSNYNRMLGILLNGEYAQDKDGSKDDTLYIIYNMYWEAKTFDLPNLMPGQKWHVAFTTYDNEFYDIPKKKVTKKKKISDATERQLQRKTVVPARTIAIFVGR